MPVAAFYTNYYLCLQKVKVWYLDNYNPFTLNTYVVWTHLNISAHLNTAKYEYYVNVLKKVSSKEALM